MTEIAAREGDRCLECGTPMEPVELSGMPEAGAGQVVFRCANGHELRVQRHPAEPENAGDPAPDGLA